VEHRAVELERVVVRDERLAARFAAPVFVPAPAASDRTGGGAGSGSRASAYGQEV
jgi:hypothetical protein